MSKVVVWPQFPIDVQCRLSLLPLAGTHSAHLQTFEHAEDFLRTPAHADVVHDLMLKHTVGVDEIEAAQGKPLSLDVHASRPSHSWRGKLHIRDHTPFLRGPAS
jgi:hypothetical protein